MAENHEVVASAEWVEARKRLLAQEKELTRIRDEVSRARRALPWEAVEKEYAFDGPGGKETLADLFDGRGQLVVYHFMFDPADDEGCRSCSFWADNFDPITVHLRARDITMVAVSRAPLDKLAAYRARMGWTFKWVSSGGNDFNYDYHVSFTPETLDAGAAVYNYAKLNMKSAEMPGVSVFYRDQAGNVYHTYSTYARGIDAVNAAYQYLDLVPKGRDEDELPSPNAWWRHHDRYDG